MVGNVAGWTGVAHQGLLVSALGKLWWGLNLSNDSEDGEKEDSYKGILRNFTRWCLKFWLTSVKMKELRSPWSFMRSPRKRSATGWVFVFPPKFMCWNLSPRWWVWRCDFGKWRDPRKLLYPFYHVRTQQRRSISEPGSRASPDTGSASVLMLDFPKLWEIRGCCLSHQQRGILFGQPEWTRTRRNHSDKYFRKLSVVLSIALLSKIRMKSL